MTFPKFFPLFFPDFLRIFGVTLLTMIINTKQLINFDTEGIKIIPQILILLEHKFEQMIKNLELNIILDVQSSLFFNKLLMLAILTIQIKMSILDIKLAHGTKIQENQAKSINIQLIRIKIVL